MAGAAAERQETGVVDSINEQIIKTGPISVKAGSVTINNVIKAAKFTGRQSGGSEAYTDVQFFIQGKRDPINLSLKGQAAPSLAGGGLKGLDLTVPGISKKFIMAAFNHITKNLKLKAGSKVPDVYGKISDADKIKIVVGNEAIGGPIHYMYQGPMVVRPQYDDKKNILTLNGTFTEAKKFAKTHDLYFRLRARRKDQTFDPTAKDNKGIPKIYGKSPSKGDSAGRIVVTDKTPSGAQIVRLT